MSQYPADLARFGPGSWHSTDGLPGYPARDYMIAGGTPIFAWDNLQVARISGSSGARGPGYGGYNVYLRDRSGHEYFMTHVENLQIKVGQLLRPGTPIAQVGDYRKQNGMATHTHIGYTGGDPEGALGLIPGYIFTPGGAVAGAQVIQRNETRLGKGSTQPSPATGYKGGPLANVPVLGPAGRGATRGLDWLLSPVDSAIGVAKAPFDAIKWVGGNWDRVLEVAGGFILVLVGLLLIGKSVGLSPSPGGAAGALQKRLSQADPLEDAYAAGEAQGMSAAARSAGRQSGRANYRRSQPSSQNAAQPATGDSIPY